MNESNNKPSLIDRAIAVAESFRKRCRETTAANETLKLQCSEAIALTKDWRQIALDRSKQADEAIAGWQQVIEERNRLNRANRWLQAQNEMMRKVFEEMTTTQTLNSGQTVIVYGPKAKEQAEAVLDAVSVLDKFITKQPKQLDDKTP
jgi:hypothetical protein